MRKKLFLSLVIITFFFVNACKKEENTTPVSTPNTTEEIVVQETQTALVIKFTGTNCPPCGSYGMALFEALRDTCKEKAEFIAAYDKNFKSEFFVTDVATTFAKNWNINSWPSFTANGNYHTGATLEEIYQSELDDVNTKAAEKAEVNVGFKIVVDSDSITFKTRTKFFNDVSGAYYLNIYAIEDSVKGNQAGNPNYPAEAYHHAILRAGASQNAFGNLINDSTSVATGSSYEKTYKMKIDPSWKMNKVVFLGVIWKKENNKYKFANVHKEN